MKQFPGHPHRRLPLVEAAILYGRMLVALVAVAGLAALFGMQTGWLTPTYGSRVEAQATQAETPDKPGPAAIFMIEGEQRLFSENLIRVEPGRLYRISGEFRVVDRPMEARSSARVYLGLDSFDENLEPVREGQANFRFPGARNVLVNSVQNWVGLEGLISFDGEGHHGFRDGTTYVAPGVWVNRDTEAVVEIRNIEFGEIVELND